MVQLGGLNVKLSSFGSLRKHTSDLNTHADTCIVGRHLLIVERHDRVVNLSSYDPTKGSSKNLELLNAANKVDNIDTGESQVVIINQAVHVPTMKHNFLCPMQTQMHITVVNDALKFLLCDPTENDHCVIFKNETLYESFRIPF